VSSSDAPLSLPAGAYVLMARVRVEAATFNDAEDSLNCSIGVPGTAAVGAGTNFIAFKLRSLVLQ